MYFSYKTVVAFKERGHSIKISKNYWSSTTGRHLNCISRNKGIRIERDEFNKLLKESLLRHELLEKEIAA